MKFDLITIFPDFFHGPLDYGIVRRAREFGLVNISVHDLRSFTHDRHRTVDDRPFGGGEGMVLKPEPVFECLTALGVAPREARERETVIVTSAQGEMFRQSTAAELAQLERVVIVCGRYEGVDERVSEYLADREISIGDFVLSGGELAAAIIVDAITRLIPGAVGNQASTRQESFSREPGVESQHALPSSTVAAGGVLDYPHYTRPAEFRGWKVPEVLIGGNHEDIRHWRRRKALEKTLRHRPDLLATAELSDADRELLDQLRSESVSPRDRT